MFSVLDCCIENLYIRSVLVKPWDLLLQLSTACLRKPDINHVSKYLVLGKRGSVWAFWKDANSCLDFDSGLQPWVYTFGSVGSRLIFVLILFPFASSCCFGESEWGAPLEDMANYRWAVGGGGALWDRHFLSCVSHLHNVLGHTVWTALSTSKYAVGNNLALASLSWLDNIIFHILSFEVYICLKGQGQEIK